MLRIACAPLGSSSVNTHVAMWAINGFHEQFDEITKIFVFPPVMRWSITANKPPKFRKENQFDQ